MDLAVPLVLSKYGRLLTIRLHTSSVIASFDFENKEPVVCIEPVLSVPNLYFHKSVA